MAVRSLPDRVAPRHAVWMLAVGALLLAAASTTALALLVGAALAQLPMVARLGGRSPEVLAVREPWAPAVGAAAALVLGALLARATLLAVRTGRHYRRVARAWPTDGDPDEVLVLEDDAPYAVALPRWGRRPGRVVVSTGMVAHLDERERTALVAHEANSRTRRVRRRLTSSSSSAR